MTAEPLGAANLEVRRSRFHAHLRCGSVEVFKNDGEVGRPGRVLLDLLRKHALDSHVLVVSRIFGGVLLGPGNVGRAFRDAGEAAIREAELIR